MPVEGGRSRVPGTVGLPARSVPPPLAAGSEPVLVRLLGPVEVQLNGQPVTFPSPKARALFALLALHVGRPVPVERLVRGLWGDDPPETATATLQAYVSRLRRVLDQDRDARDGSPPSSLRIRRQPPGYVLELSGGAVDAQRFLALAGAAQERLELDPHAALELLAGALRLVRDEPLADVVGLLGPTGATEAGRLASRVLDARERHVDALLRTGDVEEALRRASDLTTEHPLRESAQALHLLALYRSGRQAEALSTYEQFRQRLADELGADPGPQLRRLHTRLLQQDPALEPDLARGPSATPGTGPAPAAPPPVDLSVGREVPLQRLDAALTAASAGQGSVWLVSGEAGIGKSTLCHDVARRAQKRGFVTAWGRGHASARTAPYWLWAQVLRTLPQLWGQREVEVVLGAGDPQAAAAGPPSGHRLQLHEALALRLADHAAEERLVLVLEDLHWADPPSLELLSTVAELAATSPLVVVATVRSPHHPVAPALTSLLAQLAARPAEQVELTGLRPDEATVLLARLRDTADPRLVAAVVAKAEGNPFFLRELARLLDEHSSAAAVGPKELGVPLTVRAVLRDRLTALSAHTRRLVEVAAVVGAEAQLGLLEEVSGLPPDALDAALTEAVGAGFVTERLLPTPRVHFTHALVREAVHADIPPLARARLHGAVGAAMTTGGDEATVDEIARHLLEGAEAVGPGPALPALLRASRRAARQLAMEHAESLLQQALALTRRLPAGRERDSWELAVQARIGSTVAMRLGWGAAEANHALERAQHLALRADPDEEMFAALYHRISWHVVTAGFDTALTLSDVLMERATAAAPTGERFELLGRMTRGAVHWFRGDDETAVTELVRADELAARLGPGLVEAFREDPRTPVLGLLAQALEGANRGGEAWAAVERSLVLARASYPAEAGGAVMFAALLAAAREDRVAARDLAGELAELARASGLGLQGHVADVLGSWATATATGTAVGGTEDVVTPLRTAAERYLTTGARMLTPMVLTLLAEAELAQRQVDAARTTVAHALQAGEQGMPSRWRRRLEGLIRRLPPTD